MSAPTIYRSDDPSAPSQVGNVKNAVYEVLRACLVDGYTGKQAAGWSVVYDAWATDGVCTFTNAAGSGVLGVHHNSYANYGSIMFVASAMVDATTGVDVRCGRYATTIAAMGDSSLMSHPMIMHSNVPDATDHWCVIANENFCAVWFATSSSQLFGSAHTVSNYNMLSHLFFGAAESLVGLGGVPDPQPGNFVLAGGGDGAVFSGNWRLSSFYHGTVLTNADAVISSGEAAVHVVPYATISNSMGAVGDVLRARFYPLSLAVSDGTTSTSQARQICELPMLQTVPWIRYGTFGLDLLPAAGYGAIDDVFTMDGKNFVWAPLIYGEFVAVSLDAADWS